MLLSGLLVILGLFWTFLKYIFCVLMAGMQQHLNPGTAERTSKWRGGGGGAENERRRREFVGGSGGIPPENFEI